MRRPGGRPRAMREAILSNGGTAEFATAERCWIVELSNSEHDPPLSIAQARVLPGVTTRWHRLRDIDERYVILEGTGVVEIGNLPKQRVAVSDVVLIPRGCLQRIACVGPEHLVFLAICTPRFRPEAYEDAELSY